MAENLTPAPKVSIIIPMYNSEKYIAECLNSILGQTFKDFEVIVVDDCSTDDSVKIVEDYIPKFEGRLQLLHMEKNSGHAALPRNKGLDAARGDYVYFVDSDDLLVESALVELYDVAEKTQAEVVICKNHLETFGFGEDIIMNAALNGDRQDRNVDLVSDDPDIKCRAWLQNSFADASWKKFIRRDFLIDNEIKFLNISQENSIWNFELIWTAKKIIMVPYICYVHRQQENLFYDDFETEELNPKNMFEKMDRLINGLKYVDDFMGKQAFFQNNPSYRHAVIDKIVQQDISWILNTYNDVETFDLYENIKAGCKDSAGNFNVLISYCISAMVAMVRNIIRSEEKSKRQNTLNSLSNLFGLRKSIF